MVRAVGVPDGGRSGDCAGKQPAGEINLWVGVEEGKCTLPRLLGSSRLLAPRAPTARSNRHLQLAYAQQPALQLVLLCARCGTWRWRPARMRAPSCCTGRPSCKPASVRRAWGPEAWWTVPGRLCCMRTCSSCNNVGKTGTCVPATLRVNVMVHTLWAWTDRSVHSSPSPHRCVARRQCLHTLHASRDDRISFISGLPSRF